MRQFCRNTGVLFAWLLACSLSLITGTARGQDLQAMPFFNRLTSSQGLSGNEITAICRDSRGFLWLGTNNGLNQYDGNTIRIFRHSRFKESSIVSNSINTIVEDDSGYLWLGTDNGISRFNPFNGKSINFKHETNNPGSLNSNFDCHVYYDRRGQIWVGNNSGLSYLENKSHRFIPVKILPDSILKMHQSTVGAMLEDKEGRFWIGTIAGLVLYDRKTRKANLFQLQPGAHRGENAVTTIFQDHRGRIWLGFWGHGLSLFDTKTGKFISYKWNKKSKYSGTVNIAFSITETQSANGLYALWVGTSEGLLQINNNSSLDNEEAIEQKTKIILPKPEDSHSLSIKNITCLFTDHQNIMWVGTIKGLNEYTPQNQLFADRRPFKGITNRILVDNSENKPRYFVAEWYGNGLTELDENLATIHVWKKIPTKATDIDNGQVSDVLLAKDGTLWVGTFNGLFLLRPKEKKFISLSHLIGKINAISDKRITALAEDASGKIWIGTYGGGLNVYHPENKEIVTYTEGNPNGTALSGSRVFQIYCDRQQQIWVATNKGLSRFNEQSHRFTTILDYGEKGNNLRGNLVTGITEDKHGTYWISTDQGLNRFDPKSNTVKLFASEEGLRDNHISCLVQDKGGMLWMGAGTGITSYNPVTGTFINYGEQNGLPYGTVDAMAMTPSGTILAGINDQLIRFKPKDFKKQTPPPPVYITEIAVSGVPIQMNQAIGTLSPLVLHYPDNNFSASFSAPEFFNGKAVRFAYRLAGADKQWIDAGSRNFVTYSGLAPGHYVLYVKAASSDGVWNSKGVHMEVTILPPFWKTTLFQVAVLLLLIFVVYMLFAFRVRRIRKKEAIKSEINKQMADMRLKVLRSRMNPHFMFNALNSIQECIYTGETQAAYRYLSKFSKLIRMVLERSDQDYITVSQAVALLELYLQLESLRFQESFVYEIKQDDGDIGFLKIPPMLIQPFVENAIWHGLLHKEGEKKLIISFNSDAEYIYVTIQDNGIGRDAARIQKIKSLTDQLTEAENAEKSSLGIKLVTEQLKTASEMAKKKASIAIEDLFAKDSEGNKIAAGTKVTLILPILNS